LPIVNIVTIQANASVTYSGRDSAPASAAVAFAHRDQGEQAQRPADVADDWPDVVTDEQGSFQVMTDPEGNEFCFVSG